MKEEIEELLKERHFTNSKGFWYSPCLDYVYDSKTKEFLSHSEVDGSLTYLTKVMNKNTMENILDGLNIE